MKEDLLRKFYRIYVSNMIRQEHNDVSTDQIIKIMQDKKKRSSRAMHSGATKSA